MLIPRRVTNYVRPGMIPPKLRNIFFKLNVQHSQTQNTFRWQASMFKDVRWNRVTSQSTFNHQLINKKQNHWEVQKKTSKPFFEKNFQTPGHSIDAIWRKWLSSPPIHVLPTKKPARPPWIVRTFFVVPRHLNATAPHFDRQCGLGRENHWLRRPRWKIYEDGGSAMACSTLISYTFQGGTSWSLPPHCSIPCCIYLGNKLPSPTVVQKPLTNNAPGAGISIPKVDTTNPNILH